MYEPLHSYLVEYVLHNHEKGKVVEFDDLKNQILAHFNKRFIRLLDMRLESELYHLQHQGFVKYDKHTQKVTITT